MLSQRVPIFICATSLSLAVTLTMSACSTAQVAIPDTLAPAMTEKLAMVVPAAGVQIYECRARKDAAGHEWAFVAPDAELFDTRGNMIGRHGAGPAWWSADGSRVTAKVKARADAPASGNIPWLLLAAESTPMPGKFSGITSIQRVDTEGGTAPASACTPDIAGKQARVHYTAVYRFFTAH